jgi:two-component system cell cycle sensor histidine kinase/response regulator CckA
VTRPLNLLLVEDSESDAELLLIELRRLGFGVSHERVDTGAALGAALETRDWEIVICDHGMPSFDSGEALQIVRSVKADLPFIVFSGSIGEEVAVEALRAGATDVVLKTNLARVGPVIDRALAEADNRRQRQEGEAERASLEAQLRQAQKMDAIGSLVAGITHDFNNMLAVVNGYSHLILRRLTEDDPLRPQIAEMARAGEKAAALTRQLLAFSRQQVLELKVLQLNTVVAEIEPLLLRLIDDQVIEFVMRLDPGLGLVRADSSQLEQVVMNLGVNARDAMPEGGTLTIETHAVDYGPAQTSGPGSVASPEGRYVVLSVTDTGVGMDAETQERIFEPFFTTKSAEHGTGLGLSTVYGIVNQSGGHIDVVSKPGAGTTFRIALPLVDAPAHTGAHTGEQPVPSVEPWRGSATVLVVEDNDGVRHLVRELLESDGMTVLEARTGAEAIEVFNRDPGAVGLVITDMVMPGMSGADLGRRLRELQPGVRLLFMSGYSKELPDAPASHGLDAPLLQKPFAAADLNDKVRQLLDSPRPTAGDDVA